MSTHVIVVEDEAELLEMLRHVLEEEGFAVTGFERPDLPGIIESQSPELFLIDLMLPGLDGIQLAALLRSKGFSESPMIGISASSIELRRASKSSLFQEVLPKPFDLSELVGCMKRHAY